MVLLPITFGDRLRCVHEQVDEHLENACLVGLDQRQFGKIFDDEGATLQTIESDLDRPGKQRSYVERGSSLFAGAGECLHAAHDLRDPVCTLASFIDHHFQFAGARRRGL